MSGIKGDKYLWEWENLSEVYFLSYKFVFQTALVLG